MNKQQPERKDYRNDGYLEVNHIFNTLQGEGPLAGWPATFVRLAGCNLQCYWCDTEYTERALVHVDRIADRCTSTLVVITGGEPLRQNIVPLVKKLRETRHIIQIETNGTIWDPKLDEQKVIYVVSPKTKNIDEHYLLQNTERKNPVYIKMVHGPAYPTQPDRKGGFPEIHQKVDYFMPLETGDEDTDKEQRHETAIYCIQQQAKLSLRLHTLCNIP